MKIGVIGGNGVAATNRLCDIVEEKMTVAGAVCDQDHMEMVVWQATKVPSRSMFLEGRGPNWIPDYVAIASELRRLGCDVGCMCCNTAHYAIDEIQEKSGLKFINLLEEVVSKCKAAGKRRFELFCSDGARRFDIFGPVFARMFPVAEIIYPSAERQRLVTRVIRGVKSKDRFLPRGNAASPCSMLEDLIKTASAPVILGCTDLRVAIAPNVAVDEMVAVDSLECLADAIVSLNRA